jgi:hypothetical protein
MTGATAAACRTNAADSQLGRWQTRPAWTYTPATIALHQQGAEPGRSKLGRREAVVFRYRAALLNATTTISKESQKGPCLRAVQCRPAAPPGRWSRPPALDAARARGAWLCANKLNQCWVAPAQLCRIARSQQGWLLLSQPSISQLQQGQQNHHAGSTCRPAWWFVLPFDAVAATFGRRQRRQDRLRETWL